MALVYPQPPQARAANVTSHWSPFFLVPDAELAVERAVESGGTSLREPFDVTRGRVAPLEDPGGAIFSVWSPRPPGRVVSIVDPQGAAVSLLEPH